MAEISDSARGAPAQAARSAPATLAGGLKVA